MDEEKLNLKIDIDHLEHAINSLQHALVALTDVEDVKDEDYETIHNIRETLIDLKISKEVEYEREV